MNVATSSLCLFTHRTSSFSPTGQQVWLTAQLYTAIQQDDCRTGRPRIRDKDKGFSEGGNIFSNCWDNRHYAQKLYSDFKLVTDAVMTFLFFKLCTLWKNEGTKSTKKAGNIYKKEKHKEVHTALQMYLQRIGAKK